MRMLVVSLVALMLISGTAWAQDSGPDYYRAINTGSIGTKVMLNDNFQYNPTPNFYVYAISDESKFYISGYRYTGGTWSRVFPSGSYVNAVTDTTILWHANLVLPVHHRVDLLCITAVTDDAAVDLVVYK